MHQYTLIQSATVHILENFMHLFMLDSINHTILRVAYGNFFSGGGDGDFSKQESSCNSSGH